MQQYQNPNKIPVIVRADFLLDGRIRPLLLRTASGPAIKVKVKGCCEAPALKAGGQGTRYTCDFGGKELYLFHDDTQWFLEVEDGLFWFVDENGQVIIISNEE
ncbi:MAG: hypothetical protein GXY67_14065 [Clostridiales bacterium]|nr:hypothetical protein [Clostridiales bacterium]